MAFKDYMQKYPTLGNLVDGFVGNNMADLYRTKVAKFFEQALIGTLIVTAFLGLYGVPAADLRLIALLVFTVAYCVKNLRWFNTEEGRVYVDARFGTEREHEIHAAIRSAMLLAVTPIMAGIVAVLLVPAFYWGTFGLLVSTFLIVGSPAIIWWRFGDTRKKV